MAASRTNRANPLVRLMTRARFDHRHFFCRENLLAARSVQAHMVVAGIDPN
jgi:hypothetical protein